MAGEIRRAGTYVSLWPIHDWKHLVKVGLATKFSSSIRCFLCVGVSMYVKEREGRRNKPS